MGSSIAILGIIAEAFVASLAGKVNDEIWTKVKSSPGQAAFQQALSSAIYRYATSGSRLNLATPLLSENSPLSEPIVAEEISKVLRFNLKPNTILIGERWKLKLPNAPQWRDFSNEADILIEYLADELRATDIFQPVFDSKDLSSIALSTSVSADTLSRIEAKMAGLLELLTSEICKLSLTFAKANPNIRENIRDFTSLIEHKSENFIGRNFVFKVIEDFFEINSRGYFFVRGDPGIGKTSLVAQLIKTKGYIHHFNVRAEGINKNSMFLTNICSQLIAAYELDYPYLPPDADKDGGFLNKVLNEISKKLNRGEKTVIVVDGLDEVDISGSIPGPNLLFLPKLLPNGIYVVATTRNVPIRMVIECEHHIFDIEQDSENNVSDIRNFIEERANSAYLREYVKKQELEKERFVELLVRKSQGNFVYLYYVIPEIENGAYKGIELERIPSGLNNYYHDHWRRIKLVSENDWFEYKLPVILALTVIKEPISIDLIAKFSGITHKARIRSILLEWSQFLFVELTYDQGKQQKRYRIYHDSFNDFIARMEEIVDERVSRFEAHKLIADALWLELYKTNN